MFTDEVLDRLPAGAIYRKGHLPGELLGEPGKRRFVEMTSDGGRLLIDELEHPDGELVRRKYLEGQSYKEISEAVGMTVSNVGYRLHHALKSLALSLSRAGIDGTDC